MTRPPVSSQARTTETQKNIVGKAMKKVLNSHGHPFQESVASAIKRLNTRSSWFPLALEFPVQVQGQGTRIDIVLTNLARTVHLVCECKRANPALANWCFARSSNGPESTMSDYARLDVLSRDPQNQIRASWRELTQAKEPYEFAIEVRTTLQEEDTGKGRGQIEEAATQVCRGLNGLINSFASRGLPRPGEGDLFFLPVIITTANLWITETEINSASLKTGEIQDDLFPNATSWLWYDYPQSPGIMHSVRHTTIEHDLSKLLYSQFVRTLAIVTPEGLSDFLSASMWSNVAPPQLT